MTQYWWCEESEVMDAQAICVFCHEFECICDGEQEEADMKLQIEFDERNREDID